MQMKPQRGSLVLVTDLVCLNVCREDDLYEANELFTVDPSLETRIFSEYIYCPKKKT